MSFFAIHRFLAKILLICRDNTVKIFWPLSSGRRNEARENTLCRNPLLVSFHHFIRQIAPGIMEVNRCDVDIGVQGVLLKRIAHPP